MFREDISSKEVADIHENIKRTLENKLSQAGMTLTNSAGLLAPANDKSVYFTGATITVYKDLVEEAAHSGIVDNLFSHQPCLRLQSLKSIFDKTPPEFYGYFNMVGGILSPAAEPAVIKALATSFNDISEGRMLMKVSKEETPFHEIFSDGFNLEFDSHRPKYYRWVFGTDTFYGRGTTISLISKSDHVTDVGNFVRIYNSKGQHFASEIGFGVEIIASSVLDSDVKWNGYLYHHLAKENGLQSPRLIGALATAVAMVQAGVEADHSNRGRLLKKSCKNIAHLLNFEDNIVEDLIPSIRSFSSYLGISSDKTDYVTDLISQKYKEARADLQVFAKSILNADDRKAISDTFLSATNEDSNIPGILLDKILQDERLIERFAGKFPTWLSPTQARIIPISDKHAGYCSDILEKFTAQKDNLRIDIDNSSNRMQKKVRDAQAEKVPYILVAGDREMESGTVSVRFRSGEVLNAVPIDRVMKHIANEIKSRRDFVFGTNTPHENKTQKPNEIAMQHGLA